MAIVDALDPNGKIQETLVRSHHCLYLLKIPIFSSDVDSPGNCDKHSKSRFTVIKGNLMKTRIYSGKLWLNVLSVPSCRVQPIVANRTLPRAMLWRPRLGMKCHSMQGQWYWQVKISPHHFVPPCSHYSATFSRTSASKWSILELHPLELLSWARKEEVLVLHMWKSGQFLILKQVCKPVQCLLLAREEGKGVCKSLF